CNKGRGGKCEERFKVDLAGIDYYMGNDRKIPFSDFTQDIWDKTDADIRNNPYISLSDALENFTGFKISTDNAGPESVYAINIHRIGWLNKFNQCQWEW
ncbi:MAG: hypothetical protein LBB36_06315, partial [Fibromonadaceae bacterium]|nr:hypothetical protein [Fibromonadaceae bacterium]